ncbi:MAG: hypothetical protein HY741_24265 [Chloroflexi bacterium]|nr:hypothetical protein [Chloroflexota bacterium]
MPQSNEGILLLIGALFLLLGLLGGGFEVSAIKMPPIGKYTRAFTFVIGTLVFGIGLFRLLVPISQPTPIALVPTAPPPPTAAPIVVTPTFLPPTNTPPPPPTHTLAAPTLILSTDTPAATRLPVTAAIQNISVDYDQTRFEKKGMVIHVKFSITGMKDVECRATAYFSMRTGETLKDQNGEYTATDGQVSSGATFTPGYEVTQYDNLELFIPYDELELGPGAYELKFHIELWEKAHPEKPALAVSPDVNFDYTK